LSSDYSKNLLLFYDNVNVVHLEK